MDKFPIIILFFLTFFCYTQCSHVLTVVDYFPSSFPKNNTQATPAHFFLGLLKGLTYGGLLSDLGLGFTCINAPVMVWGVWSLYADYIRTIDWKHPDIFKLIKKTVESLGLTIEFIWPCGIVGTAVWKYIDLVHHPTWEVYFKTTARSVLVNLPVLYVFARDAVQDLMKGYWELSGANLGSLIFFVLVN
eukprot:TRINITY_DN1783_c0_g1_i1.p1 TRINITY_DN1783_c0_g1~~TRINITY_DN1783_c0_g1_i1.p1  ORF type:complete len:217 (-),score=2.72 TRINITY_DN1783_c0_g1_i1:98-664(-)